jgi:CheY-like chemotaxis protein
VHQSDVDKLEDRMLERLNQMGLEARRMRGGHCVIASMPVGPQPFESLGPAMETTQIVFSSVGQDRIKCLRPRFLFALPLIQIASCRSAADIESRVRLAWRDHVRELRGAHEWLSHIGVEGMAVEGGSVLTFPLGGEDQSARIRMRDPKHMILPGRGRLSGMPLEEPEHRSIDVNRTIDSGIDLEIGISTRLEELARLQQSRAERQRQHGLSSARRAPSRIDGRRPHSVLLVGPRLVDETACIESMRLRGYSIFRASSQQEALACFRDVSPEMVVADVQLGRSEGIDLVLALRDVQGVEDMPVLLVDERHRPERRDAAREVGAVGYLTYPIDVSRIASRLAGILENPSKRRFTRYDQHLSVRIGGLARPGTTSSVGRGGMYLASDEEIPESALYDCELVLPGVSRPVEVEAEVRYRDADDRAGQRGVGMRFHAFASQQESQLIDYLRTLEGRRS